MPRQTELEIRYEWAKAVASDASKLVRDYLRRQLTVQRKADASPVTEADRETETLLRRQIHESFPHDGIVGEEHDSVEGTSGYRWILDPIDGTKSFVAGVPLFGTMVAVEHAGRGIVGVVAFPGLGISIDAAVGKGAWETRADGSRVPAKVAAERRLKDGVVVTTGWEGFQERGANHVLAALVEAAWYARTWGDCYGYYLVATGRALAMIDPLLNIWDAAAVQPIMEEAGGTFTDWQGNSTIDGGEGLATNQHVRHEVLELIRQHTK